MTWNGKPTHECVWLWDGSDRFCQKCTDEWEASLAARPLTFSGTATVRTVHHKDPLREDAADLLDEARAQIEKDAETIARLTQRLADVRESLANESAARDDWEATAGYYRALLPGHDDDRMPPRGTS